MKNYNFLMGKANLWFQMAFLCCLLFSAQTFSWNAVGHRIIAQIAYDQLTPRTIRILNQYNRAVNQVYPSEGWMGAAVWLDTIRHQNINTYTPMHYINMDFTEDGSTLPPRTTVNALTAIEQSIQTLKQSGNSLYQKGLAFRILLHVVGDIHQPLHTTSRVSQQYPEGDRGGNLLELSRNPIAKNLHSYWDNGGGYLKCTSQGKHRKRKKVTHTFFGVGTKATWTKSYPHKNKNNCNIKQMARQLEQEYPCRSLLTSSTPSQWADESHELGVRAYQWLYENNPDQIYQTETIKVVKKRLALAGCRLGAVLNNLVI